MKICVCSDSHGNRDGLRAMLELEQPQGLLFCGDGLEDLKGLPLPEKVYAVKGNCDYFSDQPELREFVWEGVRVLMAHGHRYAVKRTEDVYLSEAFGRGAQVALYGHTHFQRASFHGGVLLLNPGSMSRYQACYAILTLENGFYDCSLQRMPSHYEK